VRDNGGREWIGAISGGDSDRSSDRRMRDDVDGATHPPDARISANTGLTAECFDDRFGDMRDHEITGALRGFQIRERHKRTLTKVRAAV